MVHVTFHSMVVGLCSGTVVAAAAAVVDAALADSAGSDDASDTFRIPAAGEVLVSA